MAYQSISAGITILFFNHLIIIVQNDQVTSGLFLFFMPAKTPFNKSGTGQLENMAKPSEIERNEILLVNVSKKIFVIYSINFILG